MNYTQQSISTGNLGLEGKSLSSLFIAGMSPYHASTYGQVLAGVSDPWINISYSSEASYSSTFGVHWNGYFSGRSDFGLGQTTLMSATGAFAPVLNGAYGGLNAQNFKMWSTLHSAAPTLALQDL